MSCILVCGRLEHLNDHHYSTHDNIDKIFRLFRIIAAPSTASESGETSRKKGSHTPEIVTMQLTAEVARPVTDL